MRKSFKKIKFLIRTTRLLKANSSQMYKPCYRIVKLEKKGDDYVVTFQLIGKSTVIRLKPEKILMDDSLTNKFSPTDVRTLTYLGYLDINSPKYKILAKRLSENDDKMLFAIKEKGNKKIKISTAEKLSNDHEIINGLSQKEAHMIGITAAHEQNNNEKKIRSKIIKK